MCPEFVLYSLSLHHVLVAFLSVHPQAPASPQYPSDSHGTHDPRNPKATRDSHRRLSSLSRAVHTQKHCASEQDGGGGSHPSMLNGRKGSSSGRGPGAPGQRSRRGTGRTEVEHVSWALRRPPYGEQLRPRQRPPAKNREQAPTPQKSCLRRSFPALAQVTARKRPG